MKIKNIEILHIDAGWRPWSFVKITTNEDIVGWSECTDSHGSPKGIEGVIFDLKEILIGEDPRNVQNILWKLFSRTRQSPGSIVHKAIGGIENALWDIKAKALNVPVYELFGGLIRDEIPLYWSHFGTTRVRAHNIVKTNQVRDLKSLEKFTEEFSNSDYKAVKTNIAILENDPYIYMPGFYKSRGGPELNLDNNTLHHIKNWIGSMRNFLGDEIDIALDLNFNFKSEGYIKIADSIEEYQLMWLELDVMDPLALKEIKNKINTPITSCENLYGAYQFKPFFENYSVDICSIDVIWNGFSESKKIADFANIYNLNICPHNYNGHLSTFISMQLCGVVPNLRIAEIDVDDVPWRDEIFTDLPKIKNGNFIIEDRPGWGTNINEDAAKKYNWKK